MNTKNPILLFDGECEFCNFWIQFVKKRNSQAEFLFHPLQSEKGEQLIEEYKIGREIDSVVVIKNKRAFIKSNAALQIVKSLEGLWKLLFVFWIIPKPIRDWGYDLIAKNRNKLPGTSKTCKTHDS